MKARKNIQHFVAVTVLVLSVLTSSLVVPTASADTATQVWANQDSFSADSVVNRDGKIAQDSSGNIYVAADAQSTVDFLYTIGIIKYDANGTKLWSTTYGVSGRQTIVSGIALDGDGNVYVAGDVQGVGTHYVTLKYDTDGNQLWAVDYSNPNISGRPSAGGGSRTIKVDSSGNVYIVGGNHSGLLAIKYDTNGNQVWASQYGQCDDNCGNVSLVLDNSNNVYVTGSVYNGNDEDFGTVRFNNDGTQVWGATYSTSQYETPSDITVDDSGNAYVTGTTSNTPYYLTIKYDSAGVQQWSANYGSGSYHSDAVITVDSNGNVYVAGTKSNSGYTSELIKYSPAGTQLWVSNYTYISQYRATVLTLDAGNNIYLGGYGVKGSDFDFVFVKYDSNGNRLLVGSKDNGGIDNFQDLINDNSGNIYVVGSSCTASRENCKLATIRYSIALPAPTGLSATSPTNGPVALHWNSVTGATSYNVYRAGLLIGSSATTTYTDAAAPEGGNSYYVTAVEDSIQSSHSNTISVSVDKTAPVITYSVSPAANTNGWNNSNTTVTFTCSDSLSGVQTCPAPITLSAEGSGQTVSGTAFDNAGNSSSITTAAINIDKTAPSISNPTISKKVLPHGGTTNISATTSDSLSGVVRGEYYIDTDPGTGNGTTMSYASGKISTAATIPDFPAGSKHRLYMRSLDTAGNWSASVSVSFSS